MSFTWPTYKVKKGDTLESVAKELGISKEALKWHHNTYCLHDDLLEKDITHQKKLIIFDKHANEQKTFHTTRVKKQVPFSYNNSLFYIPTKSFSKYGVIITIEDGEDKNEIKYEKSVKWIQKFEDCHIFEINDISKPFINEEEVNSIVHTLAYETSKVLYPMHLMVDEKGNWEQVAKCNTYPRRWNIIKKEIFKEFQGKMVEEYLQEFENLLENQNKINSYMFQDYFLRTLFLGYCFEYQEKFKTEREISFPIIENANEPIYKIEADIVPYLDEYNLVNINFKGVLNDPRSKIDFINENHYPFEENRDTEKATGNFFLKAFLDPNSSIPESIYLECSISLEKTKKISVVISDISGKEKPYIHNHSNLLLDSETTNNNKKGFWKSLFE
ncbi:LysM peptidoglycan-binding domain-containing protein [Flavobacterium oreochromis]|uniref:LysM domain-containing protein n=1 Tax=Flavobacterium columnare TaxID=996 RepID=A0A246GDD0_9FLAO|nr:LysM domain-containing protein [Flavobacterium oreochromis]OWP79314.1 hypothetical protein BWK62_03195 [Flavobacterium oreochromis]